MLVNQRQSASPAVTGMNQTNSSQHPQDSAIKQLGSAISQKRLPRSGNLDDLRAMNVRRAVDAQRLILLNQPNSSNDRQLTALEILSQRDFKPAKGGVEIPIGSALGGMRRNRVNAPYTNTGTDRSNAEIMAQERMFAVAEQIRSKQQQIVGLRHQIAVGNLSPDQVQATRDAISDATDELRSLQSQLRQAAEEARQAGRG